MLLKAQMILRFSSVYHIIATRDHGDQRTLSAILYCWQLAMFLAMRWHPLT
jgi:hypothetical protein